MRIAIVTQDLPMPPTGSGMYLVIHNLVKGLVKDSLKDVGPKHEIKFLVLHSNYYKYQMKSQDHDALFPWSYEYCPDPPAGTNGVRYSKWTRYYGINSFRVNWLEEQIRDFKADRVVGFDYVLAPYLALLNTKIPKILDAVDSEALYYQNQVLAGNLKFGTVSHWAASMLMSREHFGKLDAIMTVSSADSSNIRRVTGAKNVFTIPNGVDTDFFSPDPAVRYNPDQVIFSGSLSFPPNLQAVSWFLENCWKRVQEKRPQAKMVIIGKSPGPEVKPRLEAYPGVTCHGFVDDIRRYIRESAVSVAPMISGSGIKNKILEAWSLGTPVVATELAARGLRCNNGQDIAIESDPEAIATRVAGLMADEALRNRMGSAGRANAIANYSWERFQNDFRAIVEDPANSGVPLAR